MVKFTKECRHAIPGQIYKGIQTCNADLNVQRNTSLQYLAKFTKEYKSCNTWSNLQRNTNMQYLVKFTKEYKPAIPGQIY